ncbi:SHOCT domain-containing protein [Streptomyces sp. NPDC048018]|uniref:SHOCT domain-containing protein n=1 Tax=Streptomyces sp. NPDC048018 TaxID=3365499 RepID=UPI003716303D
MPLTITKGRASMSYQRVVEKRGANHTLHIVLTIVTCGLWAITGWPIAAIMGRKTVTRVPTPPPYAPPHQPAAAPQQHGAPSWAQQTVVPGQTPPAGTNGRQALVADELMRLAQLRDQGVLTPDEFEAQKARLLSQ